MTADDPRAIKTGEWYLCAICVRCHEPIPLFWILPDAPIAGDGSFVLRQVPCPHCGAKADYPLHEAQRLQARDTVPPEEPRH